MPSVIDSFVIELGLDPKNFTQGQKEIIASFKQTQQEALKEAAGVEQAGKRIEGLMTGIKRQAVGLLALLFGAREIKDFVTQVTTMDAAIGRQAITLDMSAEELSKWQNVAKQTGGSAEGITQTMQSMTDDMNTFALTGESKMLPILSQLGIQMQDNQGRYRTAGELLFDINNAVQDMDPARARAMMLALGIDSGTINTMLQRKETLKGIYDQQEKLGYVTREDAAAAIELSRAWDQASQSAVTFGRRILTAITPALSWALRRMGAILSNDPQRMAETDWLGNRLGLEQGGGGARPSAASGAGNTNWTNFLSGLSYLETSQSNVGNSSSTAQGFFQFLKGTAGKATSAGLPDPRYGSWQEQAAATQAYIQKFYPQAAAAIERGDYASASAALRGEWPSLPGGIQPQSSSRYSTWLDELQGGGPRPPLSGAAAAAAANSVTTSGDTTTDNSKNLTVQNANIYTHATDAKGIMKGLTDQTSYGADFNFGITP